MRTTLLRSIILLLASALALVGCGMADSVTLEDPNEPGVLLGDTGQMPAEQYGADTLLRSTALARARGRALQARDLIAASRSAEAQQVVAEIASGDWPVVRERALDVAANDAARIDELLAKRPTAESVDILDSLLVRIDEQISPPAARSDAAFRSAVLSRVLDEAIALYGEATVADGDAESGTDPIGWSAARGMLLIAKQDLVPSLPDRFNRPVAKELQRALDSAFTSVLPPSAPVSLEQVEEMLGTTNDIILTAGIDAGPPPLTESDLDAFDDAIATIQSVSAAAETSPGRAQSQLATFRRDSLRKVLGPLAATDPDAVVTVDSATGSKLRVGIQAGGSQLREASQQAEAALRAGRASVQSELELLAEE